MSKKCSLKENSQSEIIDQNSLSSSEQTEHLTELMDEHRPGWLNPTKCTLRWLGLQPNRLTRGEKTHSLKYNDQAA